MVILQADRWVQAFCGQQSTSHPSLMVARTLSSVKSFLTELANSELV